ncbi:glycosyltransferase [Rubrobacter xylanophilus]|uniref:glycosyltransferase n=1 Tax=Rubrobacter xylanophilus TaxID=49319 RepID=UPI001C63E2F3|nr:glycosyltransferase [Rubrobacter xylanophilus]
MEERTVAGAGTERQRKVLLTLVIPTCDEAENVPLLVRRLRESLGDLDYRVVFVDDSTDETPEIIRSLGREDGRISLIRREGAEREGGLSTAVTRGLDEVASHSVYTCVMDADLQHPPHKVRQMLKTARSTNADVVVASRYARGGSYAGLQGPLRKAVSLGSKYLAQLIFGEARKTSDPMSGFFLIRNEAVQDIQFRPTGFKVLLEILVCAPELKVVEIPLKFEARNAGVSKATLRQGLEYLTHIASLFWYVPSAGRFWKFAMVGASGVLVNNLTLVTLAEYFDAHKVIAWMFAVGVSILSNFLLNNAFTWRDVRHSSRIHFLLRGALAYPVAIMGIGANFAVYYPLLKYVSDEFPYYVLFNLLGIAAGTSVNFILSSRLVFRRPHQRKLDPDLPPERTAEEIRQELKAERVALVRLPEMIPLNKGSATRLQDQDRSVIEMVSRTGTPTLTVTGPRRLPQARTNTRWSNSVAVPVLDDGRTVGVVYATRYSTEPFDEEDLHWLTAYASEAAPMFLNP